MTSWFLVICSLTFSIPLFAINQTWDNGQGGSDNWSDDNNWSSNSPDPENAGDTAAFNGNNSAVDLDLDKSLGYLRFEDSYDWSITTSASGDLTMDNSGSDAEINVTGGSGSPTVAVNIILNDDLAINQGSSGTLTLSGIISEQSGENNGIIKTGSGTLSLTAALNYEGDTIVSAGTLSRTGAWQIATASGLNQLTTVQSGGDMTVSSFVRVGEEGTGVLTVTGTGSTFTTSDTMSIGVNSSSNGAVTIESGGDVSVSVSTVVGFSGTGTMTITGNNSTLTNADSDIIVADNSGSNGFLTLSDGAIITNTGTNADFIIGQDANSIGSVSISGSGTTAGLNNVFIGESSTTVSQLLISNSAKLTAAGSFEIGDNSASNGAVTIQSGALLSVTGSSYIGDNGTGLLSLTGSGTTAALGGGVYLGQSSNGNGSLSVTDNAVFVKSGAMEMSIGHATGSIGSVEINSGGVFTSSSSYRLGGAGTGSMTITGSGTTAGFSSDFYMSHEASGHADLTITDGAKAEFTNGTATLHIGHASGTVATITVSSGGVFDSDSYLRLGDAGTGEMTITGSGTTATFGSDVYLGYESTGVANLKITDGAEAISSNTSSSFSIGQSNGSIGSMTISSGGSFISSSDLRLGVNGTGVLTVTGSGTTAALNKTTYLGFSSNGEGELIVTDSGVVTRSGGLYVGQTAGGTGDVTVSGGGLISGSGETRIGVNGTGTMTVSGSNSRFISTSHIRIGYTINGTGVLTIASGGKVETSRKIYVGNAGIANATLNLNTDNGIANGSDMELNGGTFNTGGNDQDSGGIGTLTMTADSIIDMGGSDSIINWAVLNEGTWTGTLKIYNWTGTRNQSGGTDQLIFADHAGFNVGAQVWFYSDSGTDLIAAHGRFRGDELVPAPEPSTYIAVSGIIFLIVYRERRRIRNLKCALIF